MSLDMIGHIDDVFESFTAVRVTQSGAYVNGIWQAGATGRTSHSINAQPATDRQIDNLSSGGERLTDLRRIWINDGTFAEITPADQWEIDGQLWKTVQLDNRPRRNYCRAFISRFDVQPTS